ncbi:MAG: hypothetical protein CVV16_01035 [Gammaproteobacteria bacterium HGW-Gammaproteobacteria-6]|nr:MAG: hypothetical protein CVV16_01035 [Gammaproteobacteria bacterium HGW-Gammaproteobacteria-6]
MPKATAPHHRNEPPLWAMLLLSTTLLLVLGVGQAIFQYQQHSRVILSTGDALFQRITQQVEQDLVNLFRPPIQALNLLALTELPDTQTIDARLSHLPKLARILEDNPQLNSLYQGWSTGDYLMLRPLKTAALRNRFDAPEQAFWMVWHIDATAEKRQVQHLFLDQQLTLIERRRVADDGFDPRSRPWYALARDSEAQIITTPYIFFSTSEFGTTLARPAGRDTVIGADLTLTQLSNTLNTQQITPSTELLMYDGSGVVIAYQDIYRILNPAHGGSLRLKRFNELGSTLLARLAEDGYQQERRTSLRLEGAHWIISQSRIDMQGIPDIFMAILIPEAELLEEAYRIRRQSVWFTLLASLVLLPVLWLSARGLFRLNRKRTIYPQN